MLNLSGVKVLILIFCSVYHETVIEGIIIGKMDAFLIKKVTGK